MGMGGTQRLAKFCKYLPAFDWEPIVITVKPVHYYAQDNTLLADVRQTSIHRTGSLDPLRLMAWWRERNISKTQPADSTKVTEKKWQNKSWLKFLNQIIGGWLLIPDSKILWLPFALIKAIKIMRRENIQVILTSSPPQSGHLIGLFLKIFFDVKWIADFRDEWTGGESQPCPTIIHRRLNKFLEKRVLRTADQVIGICERLVQNLKRKANQKSALKFHVIMNGFDAADFENKSNAAQNQQFTILHCGSLSKVSQPEPFLAALTRLYEVHPHLSEKFQVQFVGTDIFGQLNPLLEKYKLTDKITRINYVPHHEAIQYMQSAHLLLLLVIKQTKEEIITGKIFEYLATGRPVLAIIPEGELAQIIRQANAGQVVSFNNTSQIEDTILTCYRLFQKNRLPVTPDDYIQQFERKNLTRKLAAIMNT